MQPSPKQPSKMAADLLAKAQAYATLINRELSTVSVYLFNDGKALKSLASGGDVQTRAYERAAAELDRRIAALQPGAPPPAVKAAPKAKPKAKPMPRSMSAIRSQHGADLQAAMAAAAKAPARKVAPAKAPAKAKAAK